MMKFLVPQNMPPYDLERLARAFAHADGLNPDATVPQVTAPHVYGFNYQSVPLWQTYLPKILEFLQMKLVYDQTVPNQASAPLSHRLPDMNDAEVEIFKLQALNEARDSITQKVAVDTIRQLAKNHAVKKYPLRSCSICEMSLYYHIEDAHVSFQPGCGCSRHWNPPEQRSWEDLANIFNMQGTPEIRARMLEKFIASGEKQTEIQAA